MRKTHSWIRPFYPGFDGLRGIAVLLVFIAHYLGSNRLPFFHWGWSGVTLFFVLSGFLITGILYDSLGTPHYFRNFYIRRSLRIFPLYYAVWLFIGLVALCYPMTSTDNVGLWPVYLGNLNVFPQIKPNASEFGVLLFATAPRVLRRLNISHFWSLCVEEQFYLIWPAVIALVSSRKRLLRLCSVIIVGTLLLRILLHLYLPTELIERNLLYYSSFTRFDSLALGAWVALYLRGASPSEDSLRKAYRILLSVPLCLIPVGHLLFGNHLARGPERAFPEAYDTVLVGLAAVGLLLACLDARSIAHRICLSRPLTSLGRVSYGFYVFHFLPSPLSRTLRVWLTQYHLGAIAIVITFFAAFFAAKLSYRFFELPFLNAKRYLAPHESKSGQRPETTEEPSVLHN